MDTRIVEEIKEKWIKTSSRTTSINDEDRYKMRIAIVREYHDEYYDELYTAIKESRFELNHCPLIARKRRCFVGCYNEICITLCLKDMIHDINLPFEEHLNRKNLGYSN